MPRYKDEDEKNTNIYSASPAAFSPRAAGEESESVFVKKLVERGALQMAKAFAVLLACVFRVGVFIENANAKAEDACFREKMSGATAERLFALGGPKGY